MKAMAEQIEQMSVVIETGQKVRKIDGSTELSNLHKACILSDLVSTS